MSETAKVRQGAPLVGVPASMLDRVFALAQPHLWRIAETTHGRYLTGDIVGFIIKADVQMWTFWRGEELCGVLLTEVVRYPRSKEVRVFGASGQDVLDPDLLTAAFDQLAEWGREHGCSRIVAPGRKGWARALPGFDLQHVVMEREIG